MCNKFVCKIPLLARRTRPSAARDDRVSCIQVVSQYPRQCLKYEYWPRKIFFINADASGEGGQQIRTPTDKGDGMKNE